MKTTSVRPGISTSILYLSVLGFLCLCFCILFILRFKLVSVYEGNLEGIEINVVYGIQRIMLDWPLYTDPAQFPFSIHQYTPLYYFLCAWICELLQYNPHTDIHQLFVVARGLNLVCMLVSSAILYWLIARPFKAGWYWGVVGAILSFTFQYLWNIAVRPDSLMNLLILVSLAGMVRYLKIAKLYLLILISFTITLTLLTKQSAVIVPVVMGLFLLLNRQWKAFFQLASWTSLLTFGAFFILFQVYGKSLFQNVVGGVDNGLSFFWFVEVILNSKYFYLQLFLFAGTLYLMAILPKEEKPMNRDNALFFIIFTAIGFFVFSTATSLKWGSTIQYFVDFQNAAIIGICVFVQRREASRLFLLLAAVTLVLVTTLDGYVRHKRVLKKDALAKKDYFIQKDIAAELEAKLKPDEYIFVVTDYSMVIGCFLPKHYVMPQRDIVECCSYPLRKVDYSAFDALIRQKKIKYLITIEEIKIKSLTGVSLYTNPYRLVKNNGRFSVYVLDK